jgi:tripartite-type tricarboxylate transporter receptor subunit TctC
MYRVLLALPLAALATLAPAAAQDSVAEFYKGKTVRIVVGIGVGSGYDINARLLARHMANYIPGNPTVIVQNQPGAGSLTMTNQLYASGPFDGTAIGASFNGMPTTPLLQPAAARFDPNKLIWLGSTNRETQALYVWHTVPLQTLDEAKRK